MLLKTTLNTYVTVEKKHFLIKKNQRLQCNRTKIGNWEKFTINKLDNNKISIKTFHNKYISAQPNGDLNSNRTKVGDWEKFELIENKDNTFSIKTHHEKYFSLSSSTLGYVWPSTHCIV